MNESLPDPILAQAAIAEAAIKANRRCTLNRRGGDHVISPSASKGFEQRSKIIGQLALRLGEIVAGGQIL